MAKTVKNLLNLAAEKISAAKLLLKMSYERDAVSRAYYSMYHAAQAMLIAEGKTAKGHAGTVSAFNHWFVKTEKVLSKYTIAFSSLKESREFADYESLKSFSEKDAKEAIIDAEEFLEMAEKYIESKDFTV